MTEDNEARKAAASDVDALVRHAVEKRASDILIVPGEQPALRIDGNLSRVADAPRLAPETCRELIYSMLDRRQKAQFERELELDFAHTVDGAARLRINVFLQNRGMAAAFRVIPNKIPTPEEIGLPGTVVALTDLPRGLVLVTGATGTGKSTTLAAMIESVNQRREKHILTVEDPIEHVYEDKKSIIEQREVGVHSASFASAVKYSLRQNPDIILIGEMRDRETVSLALTAAETGHLCFSTLHTQDAPTTVDRIIDEFPSAEQDKVRSQLSSVLSAVVCQTLLPRKGGGMVCAREIMLMSPAIATLIREGKIHQIYGAMESGASAGMMSLDQHLAGLVKGGYVAMEDALLKARDPKMLRSIAALSRAVPAH